jgi:asparagine synthase (glutamine-hydrolysing)
VIARNTATAVLWGIVDFGGSRVDGLWTSGPFAESSSTLAGRNLAIASDIHLHNREDLLSALGIADRGIADDELVLAAYQKWGERCPEFLVGEFSFAIWDDRRKRLFCCRDHIGFRAFLYWQSGNRFIFANNLQPILDSPGVPRQLNRRKLAALAIPTAHHVRHEETFHAGILSLAPGTSMTVGSGGLRKQKYWEPQARGGPIVPSRPKEAYEALRALLFQAVECRLEREYPVAALLSGGLDSSSVVAIAARCLEKQNRQLTAVSAVLPDETREQFRDERGYIAEFRSFSNVRIEYVTGRGRGPFDSLSDLSRFEVFPLRTSRFYLNDACENAAISSGARKLLWGAGGEFGVTSAGQRYYLELAAGLHWGTLLRESRRLRAIRNVSSFRTIAGQLVRTLRPRRGLRPIVLLAPDFQRECSVGPVKGNRALSDRGYQAGELRYWLSKHALERGQTVALIPPSYPLLDKRVVEFCLALPARLKVHDGYHRYLVRGALDGILPSKIQWRTDKIPFSPDYFVRYNSQVGIAREFVAAIGPTDPVRSVIDVDRLNSMLTPVDAVKGSIPARDEVPGSLYMINFLRQFAEFRA